MNSNHIKSIKKAVRGLNKTLSSGRKIIKAFEKISGSSAGREKLSSERKRYISILEEKCSLLNDLIVEQDKQIEELKLNNKRKNQQVRYAYGQESKSNTAVSPDKPLKPEYKKRGAPKGHKGCTKPIPEKIDFTQTILPPGICSCGCGNILELDVYDSKYIEDIPPVNRVVTEIKYKRGLCTKCGKILKHHDAVKRPPVLTGPNLAAHLTTMRQAGITFRKLSSFCTETLGITLSPSGALGIINRTTDKLTPYYKLLQESLKTQMVVHADETSWKVNNDLWYIWCFCNKKIAYYFPIKSRASQVVKDILGEDFDGVVVCDFYAAYNCMKKTQRCLVHLLRDIGDERKILKDSALLKKFDNRVRDFIRNGLEIQKMEQGELKNNKIGKLDRQLTSITEMKVTKGKAETLIKRIKKYKSEIIRFVENPEIEYHNNRAERQIRPIVIARKMSYHSSSDKGAKRTCILFSLLETFRLQNLKPVDMLKKIMDPNAPIPKLLL